MEKWALMIGYDGKKVRSMQGEHSCYAEFIHILPNMSDAVEELSKENAYLLIIFFKHNADDIFVIKNIRCLTNIPILILAEKYDGTEKIAVLEAGADEYIQYPETVWEVVASCRALVRRYTVLNQRTGKPLNLTLRGGVFINGDHRRAFVHGMELDLARREFDLFCLLASYPERVFTYEQLFSQIWDAQNIPTENSVHSCIRRIRRKLEGVPGCPCRIENMRGVGYCFRQIKS